jgi:hypothetical protein
MPIDVPGFVEAKNALYGDQFLLLIEIEYADGEFVRWACDTEYATAPQFRRTAPISSITFEGNIYVGRPIGKPTRSQNSRGEIPTFEIQIANPQRIFQSTLQNHIIEGKAGRLITVRRDALADPTANASEWFTVENARSQAETITLVCKGCRFNPLRSRIPRKNMTRANYPGLPGSTRNRFY